MEFLADIVNYIVNLINDWGYTGIFVLMFLDINLSDVFSFEIFEPIGFETPPIIFTTAYSEFAIRAFELNSISYLLKPVTTENLTVALKKFKTYDRNDKNLQEQHEKPH